jgi:site-specific DNA recombinase
MGLCGTAVQQRLDELEGKRANLQTAMQNPPNPPPALHPNLAEIYRARVTNLAVALDQGDDPEALEAARALIDKVIVSPPKHVDDPPEVELIGELTASLRAAMLGHEASVNDAAAGSVLGLFASSVKKAPGGKAPWSGSGAKPRSGDDQGG